MTSHPAPGKRTLKPDDHAAWRMLCTMLEAGLRFEDIALELDCDVGHLIQWANFVYRPERKTNRLDDLPFDSPLRRKMEADAKLRAGARRQLVGISR